MRSANIKNLSIALEALSRFPSDYAFSTNIQKLLGMEIEFMQEEQKEAQQNYARYNTATQTKTDEIPF